MSIEELLVVHAVPVRASDVQHLLGPADLPDSDLSASAHALLRLVLTELTGVAPERHVISRRCGRCGAPHGKPVLTHERLRVSLSHTSGLVVVAVANGAEVGIDVEKTAATEFAGFEKVALGPHERAHSTERRARAWTRKEAYLKATGLGLSVDPRDIDVRRRSMSAPSLAELYDVPVPAGLTCSAATLSRRRLRLRVATRRLMT